MMIPEPSFHILCLAPFDGEAGRNNPVAPRSVASADLDEAMAALQIRFFLSLDSDLCPAGGLDLQLDCLKALHPDGIVKTQPFFEHLFQARTFVQTARGQGADAVQIRQGLKQWPDLPPIEVREEIPEKKQASSESRLDSILNMVTLPDSPTAASPQLPNEADPVDAIAQRILDTLFASPRFQRLESVWRGLRLLLQQTKADGAVHVQVACVHAETLGEDLEALTPHVIGNLPNVILLDLPFDNSSVAIERLNVAARWAATLMVPIIAWSAVEFLQISSWGDLGTLPFVPHHMETPAYAKFQKLRHSDEGHWLCLACNRFLTRYPYGKENRPRHFPFNESDPLWIAPVWAVAALIAQSVAQCGWPTRFCERNRFQVQDLALHSQGQLPPMVSEGRIDRDRLDQLARAGLTPLASETGSDRAFLPRAVTIAGSSLAYQLLLSQATQFILWCKDQLPAATNTTILQAHLEDALRLFSDRSRPPGFARMTVTTGPADTAGRIPVHLALMPDPAVLPGSLVIEMGLDW
jgi:type VI secretion system protein ImpC